MQIGDLVRHTQQNIVGLIVKKKDRRRAWMCDVWVVLWLDGHVANGTDFNLEIVSASPHLRDCSR